EEYDAEYAAQADEVLVVTRKLGEYRRLYRWKAGAFTPISPDIKHDVARFGSDRARSHVYYEVHEAGYTRLFALDGKTYKEAKLPAFPSADQVHVVSVTRDGRFAALSIGTSKAPPTSHVLDWTTGKLVQWHLPSAPEVDTSRFAVPVLESYPARDG